MAHVDEDDSFLERCANLGGGTRFLIGLAVFLTVRVVLGFMFDLSPRCHSGWKSPSIGTQGACSYNGGVDRSARSNAFLFSLVAAILISYLPNLVRISAVRSSDFKTRRAERLALDRESIKRSREPIVEKKIQRPIPSVSNEVEMTSAEQEEMVVENARRSEASRQYVLQELEKSKYWTPSARNKRRN